MAKKELEEQAEAAQEQAEGESGGSPVKRLRRYIAPKIRTLALPSIQASPVCNPVSCPPDIAGCGPVICGPVMPPPGCGPQSCNPRG